MINWHHWLTNTRSARVFLPHELLLFTVDLWKFQLDSFAFYSTCFRFSLEAPVAVMGDRSPSMGVAIRTSNIIASLVTAVSNAELVFFDCHNMIPPFIPKNVEGVRVFLFMYQKNPF